MQIVRYHKDCEKSAEKQVIAIGNFDGVHLGHVEVIKKAKDIAQKIGAKLTVLSFYPHPAIVMGKVNLNQINIASFREKYNSLKNLGVDALYIKSFDNQFANLSPEKFVEKILINWMNAAHIVVGKDFAFGKDRKGDINVLNLLGKIFYFSVTDIEPRLINGVICSSTNIRKALASGEVHKISQYMGRNYSISGKVVMGEKNGTKMGFPTANIKLNKLFQPKYGVYQANAYFDNQIFQAIVNIGIRPTINGKEPAIEVHFLNKNIDLYGKYIIVEFLNFIRPEIKFNDLYNLTQQIEKDIIKVKQLFAEYE
jgi:riboflavin kinase / FMN adenylyltransferase